MEEDKDTTLSETHSGDGVDASSDSDETGSKGESTSQESKRGERKLDPEEMQRTLNKQFTEINELKKQIEAAKSGSKAEGDLQQQLQELQNRVNQSDFYKANPQYEPYKDLLGNNPSEAIKNEVLKGTIDKAIQSDSLDQSKSVLQTNPRIGQVRNSLSSAQEKLKAANEATQRGDVAAAVANQSSAGKDATRAVIDAYGL